jgi:hypothetical protein
LIDSSGNRSVVAHNFESKIDTTQFGTCYVAGSGQSLVERIIQRTDSSLSNSRGWPSHYPISATEDLAEHISCEMLHIEGSSFNGVLPDTPLDLRCGGYYEWAKVSVAGIYPMQPRIDLSVFIENDELVISRAYFFEHKQLPNYIDTPSQRICTSVINLGNQLASIKIQSNWGSGCQIVFEESWGTLIPSFFFGHQYEDEIFQNPLFGQLSADIIEKDFSPPQRVGRVRVIVKTGDSTAIQKRFISEKGGDVDVILSAINGNIGLWLSPRLLEKTVETARSVA